MLLVGGSCEVQFRYAKTTHPIGTVGRPCLIWPRTVLERGQRNRR
jgi:hypothetical protein